MVFSLIAVIVGIALRKYRSDALWVKAFALVLFGHLRLEVAVSLHHGSSQQSYRIRLKSSL